MKKSESAESTSVILTTLSMRASIPATRYSKYYLSPWNSNLVREARTVRVGGDGRSGRWREARELKPKRMSRLVSLVKARTHVAVA
jgi:hypothetical protein